MSTPSDALKATTPVYVPYSAFVSALDNLRTNGIPGTGKIDKTLWSTQSGSIQTQLIAAFRFLGLIDDNNRVLPSLPRVVSAVPEDRKKLLREIIEEKYQTVLAHDLKSISEGQLKEAFRTFGLNGSTLDRAIRFFVKACQEVGIGVSPRVADKTRNAPKRTRRASTSRTGARNDSQANVGEQTRGAWEERLLAKFPAFDPEWPDDLKTKWFEGFERLMNTK